MADQKPLNKQLMQILLIVCMALYIGVKDVVVPLIGGDGYRNKPSSLAEKNYEVINETSKKVAVLEDIVISLKPLPVKMAGMEASVDALRATVERLVRTIEMRDK